MSHIEWTSGFPPFEEGKSYLAYIDNVQRPGIGKATARKIGQGWYLELNGDSGILGETFLPFQVATIRAWAEMNNPVFSKD